MSEHLITEDYHVVSPAYGRDYHSKASAEAAFRSGEDWTLESPLRLASGEFNRGTYCSVRDFKPGLKVELRYRGYRHATVITV